MAIDADMERAFSNMMKRIQKEAEDAENADEVVEVSEVKEDDKE